MKTYNTTNLELIFFSCALLLILPCILVMTLLQGLYRFIFGYEDGK